MLEEYEKKEPIIYRQISNSIKNGLSHAYLFELNDNRASAILYADAMTTVFDDLVANFADFKVADKYMDFFKSKVDELNDLKQRIKEDFESSYNLSFKKSITCERNKSYCGKSLYGTILLFEISLAKSFIFSISSLLPI